MGSPVAADGEWAASTPADELRKEIDRVSEYRWMAATVVCCAVGLATAAVLITTGDRYDLRPATQAQPLDDKFVGTFGSLDPTSTGRQPKDTVGSTSGSAEPASDGSHKTTAPHKRRRIVMRLKSPWCTGGVTSQSFYRCRTHSW